MQDEPEQYRVEDPIRITRPSSPVVAIIGRPNVGKSTLFNRLIGRRLAVEDASPKTTRDRVQAPLELDGRTVMLTDTGGVAEQPDGSIEREAQVQTDAAIDRADLVLFVVSLEDGLTSTDREVADRLRSREKPFVFVANKRDASETDFTVHEFHELGLGKPIEISALSRRGLDELRERIEEELPEIVHGPETGRPVMSLVGRQNVGKSTFLNALARRERSIVTETPGTTRDLLDVTLTINDRYWSLQDTPGVERRGNEDTTADLWSQKRVRSAIRSSDVLLHLIDATEEITRVDQRIAELAIEHVKPYLLVLNKWDLVPEDLSPGDYSEYLYEAFPGTEHCPISIISALKQFNVYDTVLLAADLHEQGGARVDEDELTEWAEDLVEANRPPGGAEGRPGPDVLRARQVGVHPPELMLVVSDPARYPENYRRYLKNGLRKKVPFAEISFQLHVVGPDEVDDVS